MEVYTIRSGKGECIHIRLEGATGVFHNIIIDSGPASAAGEFRALLQGIISRNESLDALIITHYDADHIGGILKVEDIGFKDIYFNAYDGAHDSTNLSASQAMRLFQMLPSAKVHSRVMAGDIIVIDGATISIIAPSIDNLSPVMDRMKDIHLSMVSDWQYTFDNLMARDYPAPDDSESNRSSIVFIIEHEQNRFLFCGDAPADSIIDGLKVEQHFDLVKLPHHGSIRNISDELLGMISAERFLICADGTSHPNKQTIAKLIRHYGRINVISNYTWWLNGFLQPEDMKYIDSGVRFISKHEEI